MSTVTAPSERSTDPDGDQRVVLDGIDWRGYCTFLKIRGERSVPKAVYLDGSLYLVSPSLAHESLDRRLDWLVKALVEELDIPCIVSGSTTLRRKAKRGGVEGDQSYYFTNLARIRGKKQINLRVDPPPDLAVEAVVSHDAEEAIEVYRRIKVPEVWICDHHQLTILRLGKKRRYSSASTSLAFPTLTAEGIHSWVTRTQDEDDRAWAKALRRWIVEELAPRHRVWIQQNPASPGQQGEQVSKPEHD
jgi:Uma2 family endonuclease